MSTAQHVVQFMSAAVKVLRFTDDGKAIMEPTGTFGADGKPVLRKAVRVVVVPQGEPLPENIAAGELERLQGLGAVAVGAEASKSRSAPSKTADQDKADQETLGRLADLTPQELTKFLTGSQVGVRKLKDTVGDNAELAQRLIDAEKEARKGDARSSLITDMERVVKKDADAKAAAAAAGGGETP